MVNKKYWFGFIALGFFLVTTKTAIAEQPTASITFKPPSDNPRPEQTSGGGRRTDQQCSQDSVRDAQQTGLTALVPTNEMGLTTLGNPTFWVYLPETTATQLVLSVMEQGKDKSIIHHSQTSFPILPKSGLMSLKLPAQSPPLEVGKTYKWAVIILCGNSPHPSDPVIEAWVRRVDLSIPNPSMNSAKKASWYGEQGIWFDFLDSLAKARQAEPDNKVLKTDWVDTLKSIKLETLDSKSF